MDGVIGCFGLIILYRRTTRAFPTSLFWQVEFHYNSNSTRSNPAPPLQNSIFSWEKRGFGDDSVDDSLGDSLKCFWGYMASWLCFGSPVTGSIQPTVGSTTLVSRAFVRRPQLETSSSGETSHHREIHRDHRNPPVPDTPVSSSIPTRYGGSSQGLVGATDGWCQSATMQRFESLWIAKSSH